MRGWGRAGWHFGTMTFFKVKRIPSNFITCSFSVKEKGNRLLKAHRARFCHIPSTSKWERANFGRFLPRLLCTTDNCRETCWFWRRLPGLPSLFATVWAFYWVGELVPKTPILKRSMREDVLSETISRAGVNVHLCQMETQTRGPLAQLFCFLFHVSIGGHHLFWFWTFKPSPPHGPLRIKDCFVAAFSNIKVCVSFHAALRGHRWVFAFLLVSWTCSNLNQTRWLFFIYLCIYF